MSNEVFAVHYKGKLIDASSAHTRNGRVYTTIGPAKSFVSRIRKWLSKDKQHEADHYTVVRYVPEDSK